MRLCFISAIFLLSTNLLVGSLNAQTSEKAIVLPGGSHKSSSTAEAHNHHHDHDHGNDLSFVKNNGQWESPVQYRASLGGLNTIFLENDGFTYLFHNEEDAEKLFDHSKRDREKIQPVRSHAYHVTFLNANNQAKLKPTQPRTEYNNYFLGNDPSKWASHVPLFDQVRYENLYPGIHLDAYDVDGYFKYDFVVEPGAFTKNIALRYEGADRLQIKKGDLVIHTSVDKIIEHEPYAYQEIDGKRITVNCVYQLNGNTVTFQFPEGYNHRYKLVIDPTVVAATLSGTTNNENFGHSATYDFSGNIYVGAQSFGSGYPSTFGAFQQNFGGGVADIAVSKYNTNGSQLIYASYIGGSGVDLPHSLITDFDGQLYIYGSSDSNNFPTTSNAVQTTKGGRIDIVVSILTADGASLVGSTYVGGSQDDGFNHCEINASYGDDYRGEIMLDRERNVYIASQSSSSNFPTTSGAFDRTFNTNGTNAPVPSPAQDGVVFKLNNDLSNFYWSTYLGEDGADTAMGLRVDNNNNVYVTGTAAGANFPMPGGGFQSNFQGGDSDGYIVRISENGSTILNGTFWGTSQDDNSYFMDVDLEGDLHIYGISTGSIPVTPGVFSSMAGSRQFISSFSYDLGSLVYSTVIGRGPNSIDSSGPFTDFDFVPVAFMVDKCDNIYFSGYDAVANLPLTNDAISTLGGTFYLGILEPDASALSFATYYGAANHVDGGTSRFDKSGVVYQGVCSCTNFIMDTNNNAWSEDQSERCDIGVFKIDFDVPTVTAFAAVEPASSGCAPFTVNFDYTGKNGTVFEWDFGNGLTSTAESPNTVFEEAGTYEVRFVASNTGTCNEQDTFYMQINVLDNSSSLTDTTVCGANDGVFVNATTTNASYLWNDGTINATRTITQNGTFWVDISISGCTNRDSFIVRFEPELEFSLGPDFSFCDVIDAPFDVSRSDLVSYFWEDGSSDPVRQFNTAGTYDILVENMVGCTDRDTVIINFGNTPLTDLGLPDTLCQGDTREIIAPNISGLPVNFSWNTGENTSQITVDQTGEYIVTLNNNGCEFSDTLSVHYTEFDLAFDQTNVSCFELCDGEATAVLSGEAPPFNLIWDTGDNDPSRIQLCDGNYTLTVTDQRGCIYESTLVITEPEMLEIATEVVNVICAGDQNGIIQVSEILGGTGPFQISFGNDDFQNNTILNNVSGGLYEVVVRDDNGCEQGETVSVYEPSFITVDAGLDQRIKLGEGTELEGQIFPLTNQVYTWLPADSLECNSCLDSTVDPTRTTPYILSVTDTISGCVIEDEVVISVDKDRNIYIPNAFSPDNNGTNDIFQVYAGVGVREILVLRVYDRWGEQVYEGTNISPFDNKTGWDGFFKGEAMNPAVFVYYVEVLFVDEERKEYAGDVTLLK